MTTATLTQKYLVEITDEYDDEIEVEVYNDDEDYGLVAKGIVTLDEFLEFINWIDDEPVSWNWGNDTPNYRSYKGPVFSELKKEEWFEEKIINFLTQ